MIICFLMAIVFLSSFPAVSRSLAICVDAEQSHLVSMSGYDCHAPERNDYSFEGVLSAPVEQEKDDCFDVSFCNIGALRRPAGHASSSFLKMVSLIRLPGVTFQAQMGKSDTLVSYTAKLQFPPLSLVTHSTVVLLI